MRGVLNLRAACASQVSAALAEKLDINRFDEFKVQIRAILADIEDRLRDWWVAPVIAHQNASVAQVRKPALG